MQTFWKVIYGSSGKLNQNMPFMNGAAVVKSRRGFTRPGCVIHWLRNPLKSQGPEKEGCQTNQPYLEEKKEKTRDHDQIAWQEWQLFRLKSWVDTALWLDLNKEIENQRYKCLLSLFFPQRYIGRVRWGSNCTSSSGLFFMLRYSLKPSQKLCDNDRKQRYLLVFQKPTMPTFFLVTGPLFWGGNPVANNEFQVLLSLSHENPKVCSLYPQIELAILRHET